MSFLAMTFLAGCGGGSVATPVSSIPTPVTPTAANVQGQWQVVAQSTNGGTGVLIETNLAQSGTNVTAAKSSVVLIQGVPGTYTGLGGECDNGAVGDDSIQATVSGQTLSFTLTETGSLGTGTSTGTATISSDGTQITSGTYTTAAACGFAADSGTVTGAIIKPFSGTFAGMLANGSTTDAVTVTISQSGYNLSVTGTDNGTPFTLSGTVVGATFNVTGTIAGRSVQYVGLYETSANDFRVYDTSFNPLGVLNAQSSAPPPTPIAVSVSPSTASVQVAQQTNFVATVANDSSNKGVTWTLSGTGCGGAACGTLSASSSASGVPITYTAPSSVPTPASVMLTATSVADGSKTSSAVITVTAAPQVIAVTLSQTSASLTVGATANFAATVANDPANKGVTWALSGAGCSGAACGTLSATTTASGVPVTYTAPSTLPSPATIALTATSNTDGTKSATATITLTGATSPIMVTLSQTTATVPVNGTTTFIATVVNDTSNKGVNWTLSGAGCSGAACGTLSSSSSASGVAITYTAPVGVPNPPIVTITATSVQDSTKSGTASIVVAPQVIDFGSGQSPNLIVDANGNVDLSFLQTGSAGNVVFARSTDAGDTFVAKPVTPQPSSVSLVEMGVDGQGDINLLWAGSSGTIFGNSIDGGTTFLTTGFSNGQGIQGGDGLAVSANGTIDIVSLALGKGIFSVTLTNRGENATPPVQIASDVQDVDFDFTVAAGTQGQIYVAWQMQSNSVAQCAIMFSRSLDGGMTYSTPVNVSNNPGECAEGPQIFVDSTGAVNIAWITPPGFQDNNGPLVNPNELYFARSTDQGTTFSTPVALVGINQYTGMGDEGSGVGDPQIAVESNGAIDVVFDANTPTDMIALFARSTDGGKTFSTPLTLATGGANSPTIAIDSCGGIDVTWAGSSDVFFSRSTDGMAFAAATNLSNAHKSEFSPVIATDAKGSAYIVWEDTTDVFFQLVRVCQ